MCTKCVPFCVYPHIILKIFMAENVTMLIIPLIILIIGIFGSTKGMSRICVKTFVGKKKKAKKQSWCFQASNSLWTQTLAERETEQTAAASESVRHSSRQRVRSFPSLLGGNKGLSAKQETCWRKTYSYGHKSTKDTWQTGSISLLFYISLKLWKSWNKVLVHSCLLVSIL